MQRSSARPSPIRWALTVNPLLEEAMLVALPATTRSPPTARRIALPLTALAAETFIVYRRPSGPGLYDAIFAACHAAGFSPIVGQEAPRIVSTLNLVAAGLGIAIVPASLQRMQMDGVVYRPLRSGGQPRAPLLLATRRGDTGAVVRRFLDLVKQMARTFPRTDRLARPRR